MLACLTPKQRAMVLDLSPHIAGLCPRRAGKTFAGALAALIVGESKPGAISLVISLNLKQLRRLYWSGGASGLYTLARKFKLNLEFNSQYLRWEHENGSIGYLLGCEDDEQLEVIRGLEADLYLIDECKSFSPGKLAKLIDDIIDPQRSSREGRIIMIGTPGFIPAGPFYQGTEPGCLDKEGKPYLIPYGTKDPWGRKTDEDLLWSFHHWTLEENTAKPHQWRDALRKKKSKKWADDHPSWVREYLGRWTVANDGLVYRYGYVKMLGKCTWVPQRTKENPTGLPEEGAPWRLIAGLDIGFEAPTAFVVAAYSRRLRQLRVIHDEAHRHLLVPDIVMMIQAAIDKYGPIEKIYADKGNLGKLIVNTMVQDAGFPLEAAEKREKFDHIELINAAFEAGEVLIIERDENGKQTTLEEQLLTNAWDLGDEEKVDLARAGKLREDPSIPNDSTDALLYLYRGSMHHFGIHVEEAQPDYGTREWWKKREKEELKKARREAREEQDASKRLDSKNMYDRAPSFVRRALGNEWNGPRSTPTRWKGSSVY